MSIWRELQVGEHKILHTPLQPEKLRKSYPIVSKEGKPLRFARMLKDGTIISDGLRNVYVDEAGKPHSEVLRLVNNKPLARAKLTKEVQSYEEVDMQKALDIIPESYHLCLNNRLKDYLLKKGKALEFLFSNGGYKFYIAYLVPKGDFLMLILGWGSIETLSQQLIVEKRQEKMIISQEQIERFNPEMMMVKK